ncbi:class II aldolase/adducin family protein [Paenibacillus sp. sgz302251]|uniref:class II aldolase/adducin family protein n=1 Tax=Paenibacillus sp. sgz302251 TaxID=3414493 RepID=UPI003C7D5B2F
MKELDLLVLMSKYAGERFDLIQAGGGNSSVKFEDGRMAIKASGYLLSDLDTKRGYSIVNNEMVCEILSTEQVLQASPKKAREELSAQLLQRTILTPESRPSIETFLHAILSKYTLHTHPVTVNAVTCLENWKEILMELFGPEILLVSYDTPGVELALRLKDSLNNFLRIHGSKPKIVFLQNHGLITTSDNYEDIQTITDTVTSRLEQMLHLDMVRYRSTNHLSNIINQYSENRLITYLTEDKQVTDLFAKNPDLLKYTPYFPDGLVFLGYETLFLTKETALNIIQHYFEAYLDHPKVIIYDNHIYFVALNVKKAKEMEDVLKLHLMGIQYAPGKIQQLPLEELRYLGNWEAEKFRQKL